MKIKWINMKDEWRKVKLKFEFSSLFVQVNENDGDYSYCAYCSIFFSNEDKTLDVFVEAKSKL